MRPLPEALKQGVFFNGVHPTLLSFLIRIPRSGSLRPLQDDRELVVEVGLKSTSLGC